MDKNKSCDTCLYGKGGPSRACFDCNPITHSQYRYDFGTASRIEYARYCRADFQATHALKTRLSMTVKKVVFNDPATIVYWADGTKTVVKCQEGDIFDPELGLAMAIAKKAMGNTGSYNEVFKKWLPEEKEEEE